MNQKMLYADRSFLYAAQGRASANDYANRVRAAFARIEAETEYFNTVVAGGKWNYMMSSNPRSRAVFDLPATAAVTPVAGIGWGVAVEGGVSSDTLPTFDATTTPSLDDPTKGPSLEYDFYVFHPGKTRVLVTALPTQRIHAGRHLRYAVAIDDSSPAVVNLEDAGRWEENVLRAAVTGASDGAVGKPGKHTLKIWMMDPGVVLDKIVLDFGGLKPSYLGPPETRIAG